MKQILVEKSALIHSRVEEQGGYKKLPARIFKSLMLDSCDPSLFQAGLCAFYDRNVTGKMYIDIITLKRWC